MDIKRDKAIFFFFNSSKYEGKLKTSGLLILFPQQDLQEATSP